MMELAQFSALATLIIGGFGLFAFMFTRLEKRMDKFDDQFTEMRRESDQRFAEIRGDLVQARRDMAEEFRAQRAEVAAQVNAIANAIIASRQAP
jgi:hypothetical protein